MREAFVRRCEVCCRYESDGDARVAAEPELARFALRERPSAHVPPEPEATRCPWCNHLPSNEDIDTFWLLSDASSYARARIGRLGPHPEDADGDDPPVLLLGEDTLDEDTGGDLRLQCPNPACRKSFAIPEVLNDFHEDPDRREWNGREWVRGA